VRINILSRLLSADVPCPFAGDARLCWHWDYGTAHDAQPAEGWVQGVLASLCGGAAFYWGWWGFGAGAGAPTRRRRTHRTPPDAAQERYQRVWSAVWASAAQGRGGGACGSARTARPCCLVYERFETACDDLDSGLFDLDQLHCYCCMQFFAGATDRVSLKVDGHVWCRARHRKCTVSEDHVPPKPTAGKLMGSPVPPGTAWPGDCFARRSSPRPSTARGSGALTQTRPRRRGASQSGWGTIVPAIMRRQRSGRCPARASRRHWSFRARG
jgi:hypothetical protein